ncbi:hypothetical protein [Pseudoalteromonas sp.]|uniref:hypothetical protein n=1 Tax=Pseudoalteromonas sp. TaxID=53249 RepID=UPI0035625B3E
MTLPIGSGFFTGDIPGKITATHSVTNKPQGLLAAPDAQKTANDYVKNSREGQVLAQQFFQSNAQNTQYSQTIYDQPSAKVSKAISTYTEFANLERRAAVQDLIGVDIYA